MSSHESSELSSHQKDTPATQSATQSAQAAWEHELVSMGVVRYRNSLTREKADGSLERKAVGETEPGQVIARELIGPLVASLDASLVELIAEIEKSGNYKIDDGQWVLMTLGLDKLAAITIIAALGCSGATKLTGFSKSLGGLVMHELDYESWQRREKAAEKDRKSQPEENYSPNLAKLMKSRNKDVDLRVFKKWSTKAPLFSSADWNTAQRVAVGAFLVKHLVECNAWFEIVETTEGMRKYKNLQLSPEALEWVADRHNTNEFSRPYLLPMIEEPRDYEYVEVH